MDKNTFDSLLLHPATRNALAVFAGSDSHALLLCAAKGTGKETVLKAMTGLLGADRSENIVLINGEEPLGIDHVRLLKSQLRLRPLQDTKTVVIITNAHRFSREAQNAFLKLLEEPPINTYFLLSSPSEQNLLPTITSRTVTVQLKKLPKKDVIDFLKNSGFTESESESAYLLSDGLIGSALSILQNVEGNLAETIPDAKKILGSSLLEKLKIVDAITKDKKKVERILGSLERILYTGFRSTASQKKDPNTWAKKLEAVEYARECLKNNVSTKILLTRLMLSI